MLEIDGVLRLERREERIHLFLSRYVNQLKGVCCSRSRSRFTITGCIDPVILCYGIAWMIMVQGLLAVS